MGSVCVSSLSYYVLVSVVHPVAILSAVFCVICSLLTCVSDASGDHMDIITLNTNTPTRVLNTTLQQTSLPDITMVSNSLYNRT